MRSQNYHEGCDEKQETNCIWPNREQKQCEVCSLWIIQTFNLTLLLLPHQYSLGIQQFHWQNTNFDMLH